MRRETAGRERIAGAGFRFNSRRKKKTASRVAAGIFASHQPVGRRNGGRLFARSRSPIRLTRRLDRTVTGGRHCASGGIRRTAIGRFDTRIRAVPARRGDRAREHTQGQQRTHDAQQRRANV